MEQKEAVFADGMIFSRKREGAPDFVLGGVSIKVDEFVAFLQKHKKDDGWVNLDMLKPKDKDKRPYFKLNDWKPENQDGSADIKPEDTPF